MACAVSELTQFLSAAGLSSKKMATAIAASSAPRRAARTPARSVRAPGACRACNTRPAPRPRPAQLCEEEELESVEELRMLHEDGGALLKTKKNPRDSRRAQYPVPRHH